MLFVLHHPSHARNALHHFRISIAHMFGDEPSQLIKIRIGGPRHASIPQARRMILRST